MNDALLQKAYALHRAGDLAGAIRVYGEILRADARHFDALYSLGFAHFQRGEFEAAERALAESTRIRANSAQSLFVHGCALLALNRYQPALARFDQVCALEPARAESWINRGNALAAERRFAEAVESYERGILLKPEIVETYINRGTALLELGRREDARASYDEALRRQPANVPALAGRGNALYEARAYEAAARSYEALISRDPDYRYAKGNLLYCRLNCCDWRDLNGLQDAVASDLRHGKPVLTPMQNLAVSASAADQLQCAQVWVHHDAPPSPLPLWNGEAYGHERLRVAYVSADYREHAVASLIVGVLEEHDRKRFEVIGASLADGDGSALRQRIEKACERFVDVSGKSDGEAAALLRQMEVDIAVDLTGFTGNGRAAIFAQRFAPVQINFLGFSGTMGAPYMDYIVGDRIVIPETDQAYYSEAVIRLPDTYMPSDGKRKIGRIPSRVEAGLPETGFVFCSFNNAYKFNPPIFDIWMRLLKEIVGSVLWLPQANDAATRNLKNEAKNRGVDPGRLIFAPFARNAEDHLARLSLADLFLDTLPYNAHSTANDALWAGVPVLTCTGSTFAGRVAASLLTAIGLAELITRTLADYESLALNLARDPAKLAGLKAKLAANRLAFPLFDTSRFTKNIEDAYIRIGQTRRAS